MKLFCPLSFGLYFFGAKGALKMLVKSTPVRTKKTSAKVIATPSIVRRKRNKESKTISI
jgi:hypothetical protein